ncbi:leucine-zipper of insertion element IS481 [Mesorhizobium muleiense]|uniref:Leucine-zipper of insertion element IS481 n=1 Tax=Mesorhizobium muleiense TaxID=1004279 RepID=A0A1G9EVV2_9HYPH|nr:leucine-zipper of insertion element IS481 [Mesorhizobium muleiense]
MNIHKNARLTPHGRERIVTEVLRGLTPQAASRAAGVCPHTVRKWVWPVFRIAVRDHDVCAVPRRRSSSLASTPCAGSVGPASISPEVGVSPATVSRLLKRLGLNSSRLWIHCRRYAAMSVPIPAS